MSPSSTRSSPIYEVRRAAHQALAPLGPGTYGLACSGGADSLVLADAAAAVLGEAAVVVLHVDHGLLPGSAEGAARVVAWARGRGLAAAVRRVTVARRASLEAAARQARYRALDELADELGLAAIATAHTARDQAETVLLRILRGTGVAGLAGIAAARQRYVRPLLGVSRQAIDAYAAERELPVWDDPMNGDARFARVRVRHQLLPRLRQENPAIDEALLRLAASADEWTSAIDELAAPLAERLSAAALAGAPAAVRKRAFALALTRRGLGFEAAHLEALDALMRGPARGSAAISLPGAVAVRQYDELRISERAAPGDPPSAEFSEPAHRIPDEVSDPARFEERRLRPGDRMRPARLRGRSRKLSDLFVDAKVPRSLRSAARVVCRRSDGVIVWVEHLGLAWESADPISDLGASPPGEGGGEPR